MAGSIAFSFINVFFYSITGLLGLLSRTSKEGKRAVKSLVDLAAIAAQVTGFVVWPLLEDRPILWSIPIAALMISCGWWENYVSAQSPFGFVRALGRIKEELKVTRYFTYMFLTIWKIVTFVFAVMVLMWLHGDEPSNLFSLFGPSFGPHKIVIDEVSAVLSQALPDLPDAQHVSTDKRNRMC